MNLQPALLILLICLVLGVVVGLLAGMLGIGGGLIIVPVLLYLFVEYLELPLVLAMPMAIATSLSAIILTALSSSWAHYKLGNLNRFVLTWAAVGIVFGAVCGAQIATNIAPDVLKRVFACLVLLIATQMVFIGRTISQHKLSKTALGAIGVATGCVSSLMGIGGGAILVPALTWFRINIRQAIGCAAFSGFVIALFGSASFVLAGWNNLDLPQWAAGYVYLPASLGIVLTSVLTAGYGAKLSHSLNTQLLKKIFAGFLVIVSLRMLLG
ncbi:MAG: putative membrane protein YfcA [Paraglaciecola sp.]|jgi:uncharacterized membrane protein YfcA